MLFEILAFSFSQSWRLLCSVKFPCHQSWGFSARSQHSLLLPTCFQLPVNPKPTNWSSALFPDYRISRYAIIVRKLRYEKVSLWNYRPSYHHPSIGNSPSPHLGRRSCLTSLLFDQISVFVRTAMPNFTL